MHPCGSHAIIGKKGGGKSFLSTKLGLAVIAETPRILVTNLPLKFGECQAYLLQHWPDWKDDIHTRIEIIEDTYLLKRFWLYRGQRWTIPDVPKEDWNKGARLDYRHAYRWKETLEDVAHRTPIADMSKSEVRHYRESGELEMEHISKLPPVQYIIDEIQNIFPARGFMQTSQGCLFWLSQQRKLRDDLIWISQNADLVDKEFRDLTDDWLYITNWGRKQKAWFRLPKMMTWAKYDQRPGPGVSPMVSGSFRLDIQGIGQCYDTSAGVGIEGGLAADTKEQTPGIHWAWFLVIAALIVWGLMHTPALISSGVKRMFTKPAAAASTSNTTMPTNPLAAAPAVIREIPPPFSQAPAPIARPESNLNVNAKPAPATCTGIVVWDNSATVYFADGRSVHSSDTKHFGGLVKRGKTILGAKVDGTNVWLRP